MRALDIILGANIVLVTLVLIMFFLVNSAVSVDMNGTESLCWRLEQAPICLVLFP